MPGPVALPGLNDANPVRQNTAIRQISERLDDYAPLESPVLTGDPQAPTPDLTDNDTSIATTAYVQGQNYTTKTYVDGANATQDTAIAGKAAAVHTHAESDVTGLVTDLANKEPKITGSGNATDYWGGDKAFHAIPSQKLTARYQTNITSSVNVSTQMANTGAPPANTLGTQILSLSVTTTSATQVIDFFFQTVGIVTTNVVSDLAGAVYVNGTGIAASAAVLNGTSAHGCLVISNRYAPGAAGTYTFTVRVGPTTAVTVAMNSMFGTASSTSLLALVIEP